MDCCLKILPVQLLLGFPDLFHVRFQHGVHHILVLQPVLGYLHALDGGEPFEHQLLKLLLHTGIAIVAQLHGKPDHRGLRHPHRPAQAPRRQKGGFFKGIQNVACNGPLALCKRRRSFLHARQDILCHSSLPIHFLWRSMVSSSGVR